MHRQFLIFLLISFSTIASGQPLKVPGLLKPVEVIRDKFGVNHIYAQNEHDLFFTQGYCAATDRLFQFEIWRRQATGTIAEILGKREIRRDIGARLFRFRGNIENELNHYHPRGKVIITAFTEGINAYVTEILQNKEKLPLEFRLLGLKPGFWTPDVVISRHQGLLLNIKDEINTGRCVNLIGADKVRDLGFYGPAQPLLEIDRAINSNRLSDEIIGLYNAFRNPLIFTNRDLVSSANTDKGYLQLLLAEKAYTDALKNPGFEATGSNNWVISGRLSQSGYPLLANDPHRVITEPSLRYIVHLNAPGWNVVGGGEPAIPGVSIGHNEYGAWGLTHYAIDKEDLYVYKLNPANNYQYDYQGKWEDMRRIKDIIKVKGEPDTIVELLYTRHGPVTYVDKENNIAYAIRCAWLEQGCAPYLASLRIDQAKTWTEFRKSCKYSYIPGANYVWAGRDGNIGWQVAGIAPVRKNWSGLVPVPGDGKYEWAGFLPVFSLPNIYNPQKGYWATANENLVSINYPHKNAISYVWSDTYRSDRINEVLLTGARHNITGMMRLQTDYLSIPARTLIPFLKDLHSADPKTEEVRSMLLSWDYILDASSVEAGIYVAWEKRIVQNIINLFVPEKARELYTTMPLTKVIQWISVARPEFGSNPIEGRNKFLINSLEQAVGDLSERFGADIRGWKYGQSAYHYTLIRHPLSNAVDDSTRKKLDSGPLPRGGNSTTPCATSNTDNQSTGASFRIVTDLKDWDTAMFTNTPGQSGNPDSPFYNNLFETWAGDQYFPVYFSRKMIEENAFEKNKYVP